MPLRTTVLVMAKAPVPGRVKTRLSPPWTLDQAAALAEAALVDTLDAVLASGAERRVLALDGDPGAWLPAGFEVVPQVGPTFAARLARAWADLEGPSVQIGMDTPQVTSDGLDAGLGHVARGTAVLGPASDGGWWALGMDGPAPDVFTDVPMSTASTGARQLEAMRRVGLEPRLLPELTDIDTVEDARDVAHTIPGSRTAAVVAAIGEGW